jgi:hypothetical protein
VTQDPWASPETGQQYQQKHDKESLLDSRPGLVDPVGVERLSGNDNTCRGSRGCGNHGFAQHGAKGRNGDQGHEARSRQLAQQEFFGHLGHGVLPFPELP